jgi:hypothetical protein
LSTVMLPRADPIRCHRCGAQMVWTADGYECRYLERHRAADQRERMRVREREQKPVDEMSDQEKLMAAGDCRAWDPDESRY